MASRLTLRDTVYTINRDAIIFLKEGEFSCAAALLKQGIAWVRGYVSGDLAFRERFASIDFSVPIRLELVKESICPTENFSASQVDVSPVQIFAHAVNIAPAPNRQRGIFIQNRTDININHNNNNNNNNIENHQGNFHRNGNHLLQDDMSSLQSDDPRVENSCALLSCMLIYNLGLCFQLAATKVNHQARGTIEANFHLALGKYNAARGIVNLLNNVANTAGPVLEIMKLALLNNCLHIHYHFVRLEDAQRCLELMQQLILQLNDQVINSEAQAIQIFVNNLRHNAAQHRRASPSA